MLVHTAIDLVEATAHLARHLQVRHLILAHRHAHRTEREDVRALPHRIQRETEAVGLAEVLHLDLVLQRGISHHAIEGQQHGEQEAQLVDRRDLALQEDGAGVGIDAHGQVVAHDLHAVAADLGRSFGARGERVVVGDDEVAVVALLQFHAALHAAHPVAQVQASGRRVSREDAWLRVHSAKHREEQQICGVEGGVRGHGRDQAAGALHQPAKREAEHGQRRQRGQA